MAHCVGGYAKACREGRVRVYSIRDPLTDERLATLALAPGASGWEVRELRGRANAAVAPCMHHFAHAIARSHGS